MIPDGGSTDEGGRFPVTHLSAVEALKSADPERRREAAAALVAAYWRPIYKYLRLRWRLDAAAAEDATQSFLARELERGLFSSFDPERARLRTWLRTCLDRFLIDEKRAEGRLKRGGEAMRLGLDFVDVEREIDENVAIVGADPAEIFDREWLRALLANAVAELRRSMTAESLTLEFEIFSRYDLLDVDDAARPTYAALAASLGVPTTKVTNALHAVRRRFRSTVLDELRRCTSSDAEFRAEARALFGSDPT